MWLNLILELMPPTLAVRTAAKPAQHQDPRRKRAQAIQTISKMREVERRKAATALERDAALRLASLRLAREDQVDLGMHMVAVTKSHFALLALVVESSTSHSCRSGAAGSYACAARWLGALWTQFVAAAAAASGSFVLEASAATPAA